MRTSSLLASVVFSSALLMGCGSKGVANSIYPAQLPTSQAVQQAQLQQQIQQQVQPRSRIVTTQKASQTPTKTSPVSLPASPTPKKPQSVIPEQPVQQPETGELLEIKLYRSYGNESKLRIWGRVIHPNEEKAATSEDSKWSNFWRNVKNLSVDEAEGVRVQFDLNGYTFEVTSNDEGMLEVEIDAPPQMAAGQYELKATLAPNPEYHAASATVPFTVHPEQDTDLGIISDIDDTIVKSEVSDKIKAVGRLLLNNAFNSEPIPGTADLLNALENADGKKDGDVFYLSGSPLNFASRIHDYLDYQEYPKGPVNLKKWGFSENDDNPIQQSDYKLRKLREVLNFYPNKPFVLFGDSSEVDTEIYSQIAREFPGRIKAIFINNVNGQNPEEERFSQVQLTTHASEAASKLVTMGLLEKSPF